MKKVILNFKSGYIGPVDNIKLFNIIYHSLALQDIESAIEFKGLVEKGEIKISSAFPIEKEKELLPFPVKYKVELLTKILNDEEKEKYRKQLKRKIYLPKEIVFNPNKQDIIDFIEKKSEEGNSEVVHNSLNRLNLRSENIYFSVVNNPQKLYFYYEANGKGNQLLYKAKKLIELLGIGGDRSIGKGIVKIQEEEIENISEKDGINLSLSKIGINNIDQNISDDDYYQVDFFETVTKFGKKVGPIMFIKEGSNFIRPIKGRLIRIIDKLDYYINLKEFFIKIPEKVGDIE